MSKAEDFIKDNTKDCSNVSLHIGEYYEWITPHQAREAVEIAREETIKEVCEWLKPNWMKYHWYDPYDDNEGYNGDGLIEDLKKHFNNK